MHYHSSSPQSRIAEVPPYHHLIPEPSASPLEKILASKGVYCHSASSEALTTLANSNLNAGLRNSSSVYNMRNGIALTNEISSQSQIFSSASTNVLGPGSSILLSGSRTFADGKALPPPPPPPTKLPKHLQNHAPKTKYKPPRPYTAHVLPSRIDLPPPPQPPNLDRSPGLMGGSTLQAYQCTSDDGPLVSYYKPALKHNSDSATVRTIQMNSSTHSSTTFRSV